MKEIYVPAEDSRYFGDCVAFDMVLLRIPLVT